MELHHIMDHLQELSMSMSPQIWQQFVDLVFQDDLIKCKQNFDVIMDDTYIHSTEEVMIHIYTLQRKCMWMILWIFSRYYGNMA